MRDSDPAPVYHPWQFPDAAETDVAFTVDDNFTPVVPAHDLPRALAWTVARAFRLNPESGAVPVQVHATPSSSGDSDMPPEAAVFDLIDITLENDSGDRTVELNRMDPRPFGPDPATPRICQPLAIVLSVTVRHPDGEVVEGDFLTDLLISGQAGDDSALVAFTAAGWHRNAGWTRKQQSELADLICQVLWDRTLTRATDEDRERYRDRIRSQIGRLMDRTEAVDSPEPETKAATHLAATVEMENAAVAARQLSLLR